MNSTSTVTPISSFDHENAKLMRIRVTAALEVLKKYGVVAHIGNIRFSPTDMRFKVEIRPHGGAPAATDVPSLALADFERRFPSVGKLKGREITLGGSRFTIEGYMPRRHKFPFMIKKIGTETMFKARENQVRQSLGLPINQFRF